MKDQFRLLFKLHALNKCISPFFVLIKSSLHSVLRKIRHRTCKLQVYLQESRVAEARIVENFAQMVLQQLNTGKTKPIQPCYHGP